MDTKKIMFGVSGVGVLAVAILFFIESNACYLNPFCNDTFIVLFFVPLALFLLSLITYRLKDELFRAWWNFARWWVFVIVIATLLLEKVGGGGIGIEGAIDSGFAILALSALYYILLVVALALIINTHLTLKWQENNASPEKVKKLDTITFWISALILSPAVWFLLFFTWLVIR